MDNMSKTPESLKNKVQEQTSVLNYISSKPELGNISKGATNKVGMDGGRHIFDL